MVLLDQVEVLEHLEVLDQVKLHQVIRFKLRSSGSSGRGGASGTSGSSGTSEVWDQVDHPELTGADHLGQSGNGVIRILDHQEITGSKWDIRKCRDHQDYWIQEVEVRSFRKRKCRIRWTYRCKWIIRIRVEGLDRPGLTGSEGSQKQCGYKI
jgi:hypothetical protein